MSKVWTYVVLVVCLLIIAAILFPVSTSNGISIRTIRIMNAKQLATGDLIYTGDYDGLLPPVEWRPALGPYTKNPALFESRTEGRAYIFAHRATLIGAKLGKIPNPETKALILDVSESSDPYVAELPALAYRSAKNSPEKRATVAFADGHAKAFSRAQAGVIH